MFSFRRIAKFSNLILSPSQFVGSLSESSRKDDQVKPLFPVFQGSQPGPFQPFFPQPPAPAPMLNPLDISVQQRMEQAQKAQQVRTHTLSLSQAVSIKQLPIY
jgi:hypothetical protein